MFRRHQILASLSVALVTVAVSTGASGCADEQQSTPRVTFDSDVTPGTHAGKKNQTGGAECPQTGTWFTIGSFGNPARGRVDPSNPESELIEPVRPVDDGGDDQQGKVSVSCSVVESGDSFDVKAHAELTGATGGSVTITGTFKATGEQQNIFVALTRKGETFSARDCVARYDTQLGHAVAAGRVWADVECANAEAPTAQQICKSHAQFRFENCSQ